MGFEQIRALLRVGQRLHRAEFARLHRQRHGLNALLFEGAQDLTPA